MKLEYEIKKEVGNCEISVQWTMTLSDEEFSLLPDYVYLRIQEHGYRNHEYFGHYFMRNAISAGAMTLKSFGAYEFIVSNYKTETDVSAVQAVHINSVTDIKAMFKMVMELCETKLIEAASNTAIHVQETLEMSNETKEAIGEVILKKKMIRTELKRKGDRL